MIDELIFIAFEMIKVTENSAIQIIKLFHGMIF